MRKRLKDNIKFSEYCSVNKVVMITISMISVTLYGIVVIIDIEE